MLDMDGTLLDTEPLWATAERIVAAGKLSWDYTEHDHAQLSGVDLWRTAEYLRARATAEVRAKTTVDEVAWWLIAELKYQIRSYGVRAMPGARTLVNGLREAGTPTALVTSSPRQIMYAVLGHAHMRFRAYIDAQSVREPKPAPAAYLAAAAQLAADLPGGLSPAECLAVEDSPAGVAAAVGAGYRHVVAVVRPSPPGEAERVTPADGCIVIRSLDALAAGPEGLTVLAGRYEL
jgi:HAD superfamily hydrolase (TIGR01509 family)